MHGVVEVLRLLAPSEMILRMPGHMEAVAGEQSLNTAFSLFRPIQIDLL